ncbi:MAG: hypothetical protein OIF38_15080, partial [Cellvibrionaceae bacterium]|nr:hypothetical protein [Cellvibrionaceae bacterium]
LGFYASLAAIASHSDPSISIEQIELSGRVRHLAMFGRAHSAKAVPAYLSRLQGDPAMAGVVFDGLKLAAGGKPVSFKLGALKPLSLALEGLDSEQ